MRVLLTFLIIALHVVVFFVVNLAQTATHGLQDHSMEVIFIYYYTFDWFITSEFKYLLSN